jgi:hypothetical protein
MHTQTHTHTHTHTFTHMHTHTHTHTHTNTHAHTHTHTHTHTLLCAGVYASLTSIVTPKYMLLYAIMSMQSAEMMLTPSCCARRTYSALPWMPCSSAPNATNSIVRFQECLAKALARTRSPTVPDPLSTAPGAVAPVGSESMCAPTTTTCGRDVRWSGEGGKRLTSCKQLWKDRRNSACTIETTVMSRSAAFPCF